MFRVECNYALSRDRRFRTIYVTLFACTICARKCFDSLLRFNQLITEFFEPIDRCEAQLVAEDRWTAAEQNWSISGIELDCVSANRT